MNNFTKLIMAISTLVVMIGGGISVYLTFQSNQPIHLSNMTEDGVAIGGFDTVAYHKSSAAQKGKVNFQVTYNGSRWYFHNLENRQDFAADPDRYLPQFGGYDPYGMAMNGSAQPATPELWIIKDGKLYLFYSGKTRTLWQDNREENLKLANGNWARIQQQIKYKEQMGDK